MANAKSELVEQLLHQIEELRVTPAESDGIFTLKSRYTTASFRELITSLIFYHIYSIFQEQSLFFSEIMGFSVSAK